MLRDKVHKIMTYLDSGDSNSGLEGLKFYLAPTLRESFPAKSSPAWYSFVKLEV